MTQSNILPDFYKLLKITDVPMAPKKDKQTGKTPPMPQAENIEQTKPRTFSAVTVMGNKFTTSVKTLENEDEKYKVFVQGVHDSVAEFISIAFEKAEIHELITNDERFKNLQFFDPSAIFKSDANSLKTAQVMSMLTDIQAKLGQNTSTKITERLEKVRDIKYPDFYS